MNVRLSKDQKIRPQSASQLYEIMQKILLRENSIGRGAEHFWIVGMDSPGRILFIELLSLGSANRLIIKPRDVYRMAIYKNAVNAILVHNHPSGLLEPSDNDSDFTDKMLKSGDMLGITVLDHLIISETDFYSYLESGQLEKLKNSGLYELRKRDQDELQKFLVEMEKEKAANAKAEAIARKLKEMGLDPAEIKKATGLRIPEIKKL
ncbi:MAG: JAB domain-containing protein [Cyclobacteriaceae bacterium]